MSYRLIEVEQGTKEWLALRRNHVCASDMPIVFGISPYRTRYQLFEEKALGRTRLPDSMYAISRGREAERILRSHANKELGFAFRPAVLVSEIHPELLASLDGMDLAQRAVFEAKYVGRAKLDQILGGVIPRDHLLQVHAQLLVSGLARCLYVAIDPNGRIATQEIAPDENAFSEIIQKSKAFMECVKLKKPPEPSFRTMGFEGVPIRRRRS